MTRLVEQGRYRLRTWLAEQPGLYLPLYRLLRRRRYGLLDAATRITIEGFPRSGNSFAVRAFSAANPGVEVAHHTHAAAQVIASATRGLPTLVIVREPVASLRSFLVYKADIGARLAAWSYVSFHRALLPWRDRLVVATFAEVTADMGRVITRVNTRYGTDFAPFRHEPAAVQAIFRELEAQHESRFAGLSKSAKIGRPMAERESQKAAVTLAECGDWLRGAEQVYAQLVTTAARPPG